jgi:hypothetical protein
MVSVHVSSAVDCWTMGSSPDRVKLYGENKVIFNEIDDEVRFVLDQQA